MARRQAATLALAGLAAASGDGGSAGGDRRPHASPPGPPAASARPGRAPVPTAMGSTGRPRWRSARTGRASTSPRSTRATPWRASTATRPPGRSASPPGRAGCVSETGAGTCADGHGLAGPFGVAVSPDGKNVYVASAAQRRRGAPEPQHDHRGDHPARRGRRLRERDGGGACADGHGLTGAGLGRGQPRREERLRHLGNDAVVRLNRNTTTGAITQPAGTAGCVSETGSGPCADGHGLDDADARWRSSPDGKSVYVASVSSATPWRVSTATRPPGRSPSPPGPPAASARRGRGPCADGHGLDGRELGGGEPGREERLCRLVRQRRRGAL